MQDAIALAALFVAIVGFFINLWYTRRQFQIITMPALRVGVEFRMRQRYSEENPPFVGLIATWVNLELENLSSNVAVSEINVLIEAWVIQNQSPRKQMKPFLRNNVNSLAPLTSDTPLRGWTLEHFLSERFSEYFHEHQNYYPEEKLRDRTVIYPPSGGENMPANGKQNAYQILRPCTVELVFIVSFRPGIHKARISHIKKRYHFVPTPQSGEIFKSFLAGWEIKEHRQRFSR